MKKFKKVISLLMMSAMLVLPTVLPVQAEEADNNTKEVQTYAAKKFGNASIKGDGVRLRGNPSTSGTVYGLLYNGDRVQVIHEAYGSGKWWYYVELPSGKKGYVAQTYVKYD